MKPLTVVSGHSRAGTSMMMRVLHEGGMDIISDKESLEPGKKGNKYGTYEILNYDWLVENPRLIAGHAVKIVTQYADALEMLVLKTSLPLRVIFMQRSLGAIQRSLKELDQRWEFQPPYYLRLANKIITHYKIPTLYVKYEEALQYPAATCLNVQEFLNRPDLDLEKMVAAIDPGENHQGG